MTWRKKEKNSFELSIVVAKLQSRESSKNSIFSPIVPVKRTFKKNASADLPETLSVGVSEAQDI
jgi:hypothetical protein